MDKRSGDNMSGIQDILLEESHAPPLQHVYTIAGSGTETIPGPSPITYSTVIIEVWGGTGGGGSGTSVDGAQGGGGGSGAYCRSSYSLSGASGKTMSYTVGAPNSASLVASGTFTITSMSSPGGGTGGSASGGSPGNGGSAGVLATGGTVVNDAGDSGLIGYPIGNGGGGAAIIGIYSNGKNGMRGSFGSAQSGSSGVISFTYLQ